jgi:hypothetical protein
MRYALVALLVLGSLVPLATVSALQCTPPPLVNFDQQVGPVEAGPLIVTWSVCEQNETWGYSYNPGTTCQFVDPQYVDGILVPGTNANYCLPGVPISNSGNGNEPDAKVCATIPSVPILPLPPLPPQVPPLQPLPVPTSDCEEQTIYTDPNCAIANSPPFHFFGTEHYCDPA